MKQYLSALIIGIAAILSVVLLSNAYKYKFKSQETISVVWLAETDLLSDIIEWEG